MLTLINLDVLTLKILVKLTFISVVTLDFVNVATNKRFHKLYYANFDKFVTQILYKLNYTNFDNLSNNFSV